ncbi:MAG: DUF4384 domain-containing protein [Gemmatimonadota bacterium]|nr:DUF4384 domain-containing protein [Gemmatimonadota bacterium]
MLTPILIASLALPGLAATDLPIGTLGRHRGLASPYVEVWTNRDDVYHRGDRIKVYFRTDFDAYVTLFRIDTDGRIRVLFPLSPWDDNFAVGGVRYQIDPRNDGYTFRVDDYPGEGYLFAIASLDPFTYARYVRGDHWDYRVMAAGGRIVGDPYVAVGDIIDAIVPQHYVDYGYDLLPYYVEERYAYPRFLCYDCHAYAAYPYWNPYAHSCVSFRIVIYDDPYFYPARAVYGTRVVYQRPVDRVPRYVFKERNPNDDYVVTVRERPVDPAGRRRIAPGATARTLPGGTQLPTPRAQPAQSPVTGRRTVAGTPAPGTPAPATPRTPTLERRDPARAPTSTPAPTGRRNVPTRDAEPQAIPVPRSQPAPRAEPPRKVEPQPERGSPERRATPQRGGQPTQPSQPTTRRPTEPSRSTPPSPTPTTGRRRNEPTPRAEPQPKRPAPAEQPTKKEAPPRRKF